MEFTSARGAGSVLPSFTDEEMSVVNSNMARGYTNSICYFLLWDKLHQNVASENNKHDLTVSVGQESGPASQVPLAQGPRGCHPATAEAPMGRDGLHAHLGPRGHQAKGVKVSQQGRGWGAGRAGLYNCPWVSCTRISTHPESAPRRKAIQTDRVGQSHLASRDRM